MPIDSGNLALKGLDDLFSTEEKRQEEQREQVQQIPIDALHLFTNHPFKVLDDEAMTRTVESIAQYGVLAPLIARPRPDGDGYEIISGHRRQYAAKLAGLDTLPVIVRQMSDDAAVILMVDSNLQREHILPSERALAYKMKLDAMRRTKVHDFRAHLNILQGLLQNQEYDAAEQYLNSVTKEQTDRLFLVNSHHSILDALFNTKATEAIRKGIDIDFELNDLSTLPFDVSDMVVLFSNLLDNAIEACEKVDGNRVIRVSVVLKRSLLFSIRNTTLPVKIKNDTIQTTKPNASLHGFGLSNIKLILNKYHADFVMDYTDGWFQFTGEIET